MPDLKIEGLEGILREMSAFPKKFTNQLAKDAIKQGMTHVVLRDAKRIVARDTGQLEKSLKVRTAKGHRNKRLPRGVIGFQIEAVKTKRIDAYYAVWVFANRRLRDGRIRPGDRTLRKALYDNQRAYEAYVEGRMKRRFPDFVRKARIEALKYKG